MSAATMAAAAERIDRVPTSEAPACGLDGTLRTVAAHVPPALVPAEAFARVLAVAACLPAALTDWIYLESRLGRPDGAVDLIVGIERAGRAILAAGNPAIRIAPALAARPEWRRVAELCRAWTDDPALSAAVERAWLEFDVPTAPAGDPVPGVFVDLAREAAGDLERLPTLLAAVLRPLLGGGMEGDTEDALLRCVRALPPGARVPYVGVLLPRRTDTVRLCVAGLPPGGLPAYLRRAGWPGDAAALAAADRRIVDARGPGAEDRGVLVHLDLRGGVLAPLGIEYHFAREGQARGRVADLPLLEHLAERGLCTPERAAGVAAWPGATAERFPHQLWPSIAVRRVNHVKVVFDGAARAMEAKAYACLHHAYRAPRAAAG